MDVVAIVDPSVAAPPKTALVVAAPNTEGVVETAGFPKIFGAVVVAPKAFDFGEPKTEEGAPKTFWVGVVEVAPKTLGVVEATETAAPNGFEGVVVAGEPKTFLVAVGVPFGLLRARIASD